MKIALLSRNRKLYSSRRIIEAAEQRGHEIVVIDVLRAWHSGLLPVYVAWVLFGLLGMVLWLVLA